MSDDIIFSMKDLFQSYIQAVSTKFSYETTSEMGYRADFERLLEGVFETIKVKRIDHDAKAREGNKPDFAVVKDNVPLVYIEAKDIGVSLDKIEKSEQMSRYFGYGNLVLTDYVEFRFYRNGIPYGEPIKIAEYDIKNRTISPIPENYGYLAKTLVDFTQSHKEPIKSGKHLAKIMGGKAQRIRDNVRHLFDNGSEKNADLVKLHNSIKELLVHDLTHETFADMYAQTLVYGLFVARYHDESLGSFSREEARRLIPNSNKFLQRFFDHIAVVEFKSSLKYIVDELCEVFSHADVRKLTEDYFKTSKMSDPVIHFYEDFLNEYDPELRKKMGAYYTPQPVVDFIINSVDEILKKDFSLVNGIADTTKLADGKHKVQILDPATGTGTFLSKIIKEIYRPFYTNKQQGRWPAYVHRELLPRIHGFELMMAPYTIAHLRLGIEFRKTGFWNFHRRLGIYLTNTLEEHKEDEQIRMAFGLAESIAEESKEAGVIKNEMPIMVVVGNPPYSGVSSNETKYANSLVERYKVEPGGNQKLQERKHWLNDDYVKFMAFAESMIEKTGYGVMAMITNNGYLDNPSFRGMRWHLAKTFDKIYVLDLHGSTKKQEKAPDGGKDENVFDIMQGVGIILAVKTRNSKDKLADVYHADLYGTRKNKFNALTTNKIPKWQKLTLDKKMVYFLQKDIKGQEEYEMGFKLDELFLKNATGIVTGIDRLSIFLSENELEETTRAILSSSNPYEEFNIKDGRKYSKEERLNELRAASENEPTIISYRPFDTRFMYYTWKSECWINSPRSEIMSQLIGKENIAILSTKQTKEDPGVFITSKIAGHKSFSAYDITSVLPLYVYADNGTLIPNLANEIVSDIEKVVGATSPKDIFDYIYSVLHSPSYRGKYKEFLKVDFPRIPYPSDVKSFRNLVKLGRELRLLHLFESPKVSDFITIYPKSGSDTVEKLEFKDGNVYINESQYFGDVPEVAWKFWIGGYQPAQKWLKDRKGMKLTNEEIEHYQKIIVTLTQTEKIMKEIDKVLKGGVSI